MKVPFYRYMLTLAELIIITKVSYKYVLFPYFFTLSVYYTPPNRTQPPVANAI